jgi:hypothetical protein
MRLPRYASTSQGGTEAMISGLNTGIDLVSKSGGSQSGRKRAVYVLTQSAKTGRRSREAE